MREEERDLFSLKRTLNGDLAGRRILLYRPRARRLEGDWLADIEARSASFAADYTSMQLRELNAADTREMREALADHKAQLTKKTVLRKLTRLSPSYEQPQQLACGLMAIALDAPSLDAQAIVRAYLVAALAADGGEALAKVEDMGCADEFRAAIAAWVGFKGDVSDFIALGRHVLLGALASALPSGAAPIPPSDATLGNAAVCQGIVRSWCQSAERGSLFELAQIVEEVANIEQMLAQVPLDALGDIDVFPCIDALILRRLFRDIATAPETAAGALARSPRRATTRRGTGSSPSATPGLRRPRTCSGTATSTRTASTPFPQDASGSSTPTSCTASTRGTARCTSRSDVRSSARRMDSAKTSAHAASRSRISTRTGSSPTYRAVGRTPPRTGCLATAMLTASHVKSISS